MKKLIYTILISFVACAFTACESGNDKMNKWIVGKWSPVLAEEDFIDKEYIQAEAFEVKADRSRVREIRKYTSPSEWIVQTTVTVWNFTFIRVSGSPKNYHYYTFSKTENKDEDPDYDTPWLVPIIYVDENTIEFPLTNSPILKREP